jgi:hypothetical protein
MTECKKVRYHSLAYGSQNSELARQVKKKNLILWYNVLQRVSSEIAFPRNPPIGLRGNHSSESNHCHFGGWFTQSVFGLARCRNWQGIADRLQSTSPPGRTTRQISQDPGRPGLATARTGPICGDGAGCPDQTDPHRCQLATFGAAMVGRSQGNLGAATMRDEAAG